MWSPGSRSSGWSRCAMRSGATPGRLARDRRVGGQRRAVLAGRPLCPAGGDGRRSNGTTSGSGRAAVHAHARRLISSGAPAGTLRATPVPPRLPMPPAPDGESGARRCPRDPAHARMAAVARCRQRRRPSHRAPSTIPFAVGEKLTLQRQAGHADAGLGHAARWPRSTPCRGRREPSGSGSGSRARRSSTRWTTCWSPGSAPTTFAVPPVRAGFRRERQAEPPAIRDLSRTPGSSGSGGRDTTLATPADPLDDAAFFYFVRVTPLEVGKTVHLPPVLPEGQEPGHDRGGQAGEDGAARRAARWIAWSSIRSSTPRGCSPSAPTRASGSPTTFGGCRCRSAASFPSAPSPFG